MPPPTWMSERCTTRRPSSARGQPRHDDLALLDAEVVRGRRRRTPTATNGTRGARDAHLLEERAAIRASTAGSSAGSGAHPAPSRRVDVAEQQSHQPHEPVSQERQGVRAEPHRPDPADDRPCSAGSTSDGRGRSRAATISTTSHAMPPSASEPLEPTERRRARRRASRWSRQPRPSRTAPARAARCRQEERTPGPDRAEHQARERAPRRSGRRATTGEARARLVKVTARRRMAPAGPVYPERRATMTDSQSEK